MKRSGWLVTALFMGALSLGGCCLDMGSSATPPAAKQADARGFDPSEMQEATKRKEVHDAAVEEMQKEEDPFWVSTMGVLGAVGLVLIAALMFGGF